MKTLRSQLRLLAGIGVAGVAIMSSLGIWSAAQVQQITETALQSQTFSADVLPPPLYVIETRLLASQVLEGTRPPATARQTLQRLRSEYDDRLKHWAQTPIAGLPASELVSKQTHPTAQQVFEHVDALITATERDDQASKQAHLKQIHSAYNAHRQAVDELVKVASAHQAASVEQEHAMAHQAMVLSISIALLISVAMLIAARSLISRVFKNCGGEPSVAADVAMRVAGGELGIQVQVRPGDETSVMAALALMSRKLSDVVGAVASSAEQVSVGAQQIAAGTTDLSNRTERQAGNLQQTASTMDEFSSTVAHTAEAAQQAAQLAHTAKEVATQGAKATDEAMETMQSISASSRRIADITSVIDGIAFQTNILALNAAVEAARAGEQGRGFAVVAGEVRNLAQRSATAAKEISSLIADSVAKVEAGTRTVEQAGNTMNDIVAQVTRVNNLIDEISNATREQTSGIGLVSKAIADLDAGTQQNTALVEESAAASMTLKEQAEALTSSIGYFSLTK
nr:methyl-accepting chemotaxis protein [uncultured Aquabacterium sp.]